MTNDVLEVSVRIEAAPETVFGFFVDATKYTQWMGSEATIEAVPGGLYRVYMRDGVEAVGQFVEVDPPKRVVFTWGWHGDGVVGPGSTRVEISLSPVGDSATDVVLRHYGLPGAEQR
ncbi:MAG: SRPBCC domain-containing protein, partial [Marmoricola sp.]